MRRFRGNGEALTAENVHSQQDRRSVEQIVRDRRHTAMLGLGEERASRPFVEGSHRGAAPDLIVEAARRFAAVGPARRLAEIPAKDQRHLVFGISPTLLNLSRIAR